MLRPGQSAFVRIRLALKVTHGVFRPTDTAFPIQFSAHATAFGNGSTAYQKYERISALQDRPAPVFGAVKRWGIRLLASASLCDGFGSRHDRPAHAHDEFDERPTIPVGLGASVVSEGMVDGRWIVYLKHNVTVSHGCQPLQVAYRLGIKLPSPVAGRMGNNEKNW
jgi:hypothetical protein